MKRKLRKALALLMSVTVFSGTVDFSTHAQESTVIELEATNSVLTDGERVIIAEENASKEITSEVSIEEESKTEESTRENSIEEESKTEESTRENSTEEESKTEESAKENSTEEGSKAEENNKEVSNVEESTEEISLGEETQADGGEMESVYEAENYKVTFTLINKWNNGYNVSVKIENISDKVMHDWYLSYDSKYEITNIWNAKICESTESYSIVKNLGWNQDIEAGSSVEFGFTAEGEFPGFPAKYELLGESIQASTEDYVIEYSLENDWDSGFTGKITITNNTERVLEDWTLEFDFDREITNIWNAIVDSYKDNHYVIMNAGHNSNIAAGETVSFGFNGQGGSKEDEPYNCKLYSYKLQDAEIDIKADSDNDSLPDFMEDYFGTDKSKKDTDGDGLSDYIEVYSIILNPLLVDTDGNGISDGDEDIDQDGLTNIKELESGTSLVKADTDEDGLSDYDEIAVYGTDPLKMDTDGDGASDSKEIELGTDPLVKDSSFNINIVADEKDTVKVSVSTVLSGDQLDSFSVEKYENDQLFPDTMPGYIGGAYDFSVDGNIDSATISFEFDSSLLNDEAFDPVIYYYNEETHLLEELNTTVNGNVASAQVSHFSKYILLNRLVLNEAFIWQDVWSTTGYSGVEVVLVIDDSGSMSSNDRNNQRLSVAKDLIDELPENSKVGIVRFASSISKLTEEITDNKEVAKSFLTTDYFRSYGGTWMYNAINSAFSLFQSTDDTILKMIVVLSDGATADTGNHSSVITSANNNNVKLYTVGLGNSTGYFTNYLKPLAEKTSGAFYLASDAGQLTDIYKDINKKIDIETDSDGDGIADYYEENMVMFNGVTIKTDKNNPDSDGDGLYDGEEIELSYEYNEDRTKVKVLGKLLSDPLEDDTDGDGLTDVIEKNYYHTNPLEKDTDGDGLDDIKEIKNGFNPIEADEDGDGRLDLQEYEEGTEPNCYDKEWNDYVWDFMCGLIAGDFIHETDSVPVELGQVTSGLVPIADARDVIANVAYGDWLFAGISAVGIVPVVGDVAKTASKIAKFIFKNIDDVPKIARLFAYMVKNFPDITKELAKSDEFVDAVKQLSKTDTSKLTKKETEAINEALEKAGLSEYKINRSVGNLSGQWKAVNESMSDFSKAYQKQITGQEGMVWIQNGVKFDGMKNGVLLDAKGKYSQFIDKNTGKFYNWFSGKQSLIDEAKRQINASEGAKIQWYFAEEETRDVVQDLFMEEGITEIDLIFEASK